MEPFIGLPRFIRDASYKASPVPDAYINRIATAVPDHDIHAAFVAWASARIADDRVRKLFDRMAARSGIEHRWSVLPKGSPVATGGFYSTDPLPPTSARMDVYATAAPELALQAIGRLGPDNVTHLIVASCTGFVAPGIDQIIARRLGLAGDVERLLIGFMGCYAAVTALRSARHIVRSDPEARVLVVTVELSTLHLQPETGIESLLAMLQFGDGAAAALVTADPKGLAIDAPFAATLPDSADLIGWRIGDRGFAMHLSGEVPSRIAEALGDEGFRQILLGDVPAGSIEGWAVHAGGRSILDAVEHGLGLDPSALAASRGVLRDHGNMSSSTLMFALERLMDEPPRSGLAIAFGPGLAAEGFRFSAA